MWNGFWKLTVMVGIIGIGLFAAYQAQKGMGRFASTEATSPSSEDGIAPTDSNNERVLVAETSPDDRMTSSLDGRGSAKKAKRLRPQKDDDSDSAIELVANVATDEKHQVLTASESRKAPPQVATPKRTAARKALALDDDFPDAETPAARTNEPAQFTNTPAQLPDDDFSDVSPPEKKSASNPTGRKVKAATVEKTNAEPETTEDPFSNEPSAPLATESAAAFPVTESSPNDEPGRARLKSDFGDVSDIPRSRRAIAGAGRRTEKTIEAESDPFADDPKPAKSQPDTTSSSALSTSEREPTLGVPERLDQPSDSESLIRKEAAHPATPRSLPADPKRLPDEEDISSRTRTPKNRQVVPADVEKDLLESPPRSREPQSRRVTEESVTPVDLVGDGEVGDASQRGIQQPRLTIEKIAQQQAVLDQPLVYSIIVKNAGSVDAHNVVIEDRIPKGSTLVGTSPRAELSGNRLMWNQPLLKPNEEKKISIKVIPNQEGPIGSVARVYFTTEVSAEIQVAAPRLDFTVKAPREVRIGQKFDMTFTLKNVGTVDASKITVRDIVPENLKHEAGVDIECPIGNLAPNEVREIVLPVVAVKTGSIVNRALLTADSGVKKELASSIDIVGESLVLTRTGQNRLYLERPAVFTNSVRNEGNLLAPKVRISEVVPAGMEFDAASDDGKYDPNQRAVIWTLGPLEPGADKAVTVKYVPKSTGVLEGKITATGAMGSVAAVKSTVDVYGKPELQMETLSATGTVTVGEQITSKFQLKNSGTAAAQNVQLRVRLPRELRMVKVRGANFQQKGEYILFEPIPELAPRTTAAFELILEPIDEADARIGLEISANHLSKPHRREETIQIARDPLK